MTPRDVTDRLKSRLMIAGILALVGIALSVADRLVAAGSGAVVNNFAAALSDSRKINAVIDSVLGHYPIGAKSVTTWKVMTPDKNLLRLEQRIVVPYDFATVKVNHELSQQILAFGARVAATERSKEKIVTMHIVNHGVIIRTISFAMRPYEPRDRVEQVKGSTKRRAH
jgi:hypothetical protein